MYEKFAQYTIKYVCVVYTSAWMDKLLYAFGWFTLSMLEFPFDVAKVFSF